MVTILSRDEVVRVTREHVRAIKEGIMYNLSCPFPMCWLLFGRDLMRVEPPPEVLLAPQFTRPWIIEQIQRYQPYASAWLGLLSKPRSCPRDWQLFLASYIEYDDVSKGTVQRYVCTSQDEIVVRVLNPYKDNAKLLVDFVQVDTPEPGLYAGMLAGVLREGMRRC